MLRKQIILSIASIHDYDTLIESVRNTILVPSGTFANREWMSPTSPCSTVLCIEGGRSWLGWSQWNSKLPRALSQTLSLHVVSRWPALCEANIMSTASHAHKQDVASLFFRKPGMLVHVFLWYHHLWIHVKQSCWPTAMAVRNLDCTASPPRMPYHTYLELPVVRNYCSKLKQHYFLLFGYILLFSKNYAVSWWGFWLLRECLPPWLVFTLFGREITPFQILVSTVMGGPSAPKRSKTKKTLGGGKKYKFPKKAIISEKAKH